MTIAEIWEQAKALNSDDRRELARLLIESLIIEPDAEERWGQNMVRLLEELGPIELVYPEIEDPIEWVKKIRQASEYRLKPYWDGEK